MPKLCVLLKGFHELDDKLPKGFFEIFENNFGFVVVPVGLDEPEDTPDELAADSVDIDPFDDVGCSRFILFNYYFK